MRVVTIIMLVASSLLAVGQRDNRLPINRQPIIDVHKHASRWGADDASARKALMAEMDAENIVLSLLHINEPGDVEGWLQAAPGRFIGGPRMPCPGSHPDKAGIGCFPETNGWPDLTWLERELAAGHIGELGEMGFNYSGTHPDDKRMSPYWALAAKYDVPVAVHISRGPPPGVGPRRDPKCCPAFNGEMGNPALLRSVLKRHPRLRILLQHAGAGGSPGNESFDNETFALLADYATVYFDMSIVNDGPADVHEAKLRRFLDAGFGDRIMFGSDTRPAGPILRRIENIGWLTASQRRAMLYDNAARFLRLDDQTIARHHGR